jgi:hypothetical protein
MLEVTVIISLDYNVSEVTSVNTLYYHTSERRGLTRVDRLMSMVTGVKTLYCHILEVTGVTRLYWHTSELTGGKITSSICVTDK